MEGPLVNVAAGIVNNPVGRRVWGLSTPHQLGIVRAQTGAQQIPAFALAHGAQAGATM